MNAKPLFGYESHIDPRTVHAQTMVVTLGSFADAGHAQRLLNDHLLNVLSNHLLGQFDADQVISYREQRPTILFNSDHFSQYRTPSLTTPPESPTVAAVRSAAVMGDDQLP